MDKEKAKLIASSMMDVASNIRREGSEVALVFGFCTPDGMLMLPAAAIPAQDNDDLVQRVRTFSASLNSPVVFTAVEAWIGKNPFYMPSQDPGRRSAILVTASGAGISFGLMRYINDDGTLGDVEEVDSEVGGRFSNLSNREMMN